MTHPSPRRLLLGALCAALTLTACLTPEEPLLEPSSPGDQATDGGIATPGDDGGSQTGGEDAGTQTGGDDAGTQLPDAGPPTDGGVTQPQHTLGPAQVFRTTPHFLLADSALPGAGVCAELAPITASSRVRVVDLETCAFGGAVPKEATAVAGAITVTSGSIKTLDVRVGQTRYAVGPLQSSTHGFLVQLERGRTFTIEVPGSDDADVRLELTAVLVPETSGGDYVHLLAQPERWFASNPNDDGFRDVWPRLDSVLRFPVAGAELGATGMLGAVHLGPGVWRDERVWFHMGPASAPGARGEAARWSSVPVDGHFPWRYSSFFVTGADAAGEVELSASAVQNPQDTGIEPWVDAVGFLSPQKGLVHRPLAQAWTSVPATHVNAQDYAWQTGLAGVEGVTGTLTFDLPHWPFDERNRWFFVSVGDDPARFGGALGGGLEGPDWMTAGLNQNGRVTVRFTSRLAADGRLFITHNAYVAGGSSVSASYHLVTAQVSIDGVLVTP